MSHQTLKQKHADRLMNVSSVATMLLNIAAFARSKQCAAAFQVNSSKAFPDFSNSIFMKLRSDFDFQIQQSPWRNLVSFSEAAEEYAKHICDIEGVKLPKSSNGDRSASLFSENASMIAYSLSGQLNKLYCRMPPTYKTIRVFDLSNVTYSLHVFLRAIHTLTHGTGCRALDQFITRQARNETYWQSGYPHDLLVHDVESLLAGKSGHLLIRCDYASSYFGDMPDARREGMHLITVYKKAA